MLAPRLRGPPLFDESGFGFFEPCPPAQLAPACGTWPAARPNHCLWHFMPPASLAPAAPISAAGLPMCRVVWVRCDGEGLRLSGDALPSGLLSTALPLTKNVPGIRA